VVERSCADFGRCLRISLGIESGLGALPIDALRHAGDVVVLREVVV